MKSDYDREKLQEHLTRLSGGVAVLHVGADSEVEIKEKKDRAEDALSITHAVIEEGTVPGGNTAYIRAVSSAEKLKDDTDNEHTGIGITKRVIEEPLRQIVASAAKEGAVTVQRVRDGKGTFGYNARTDGFEDLMKYGVIGPAKITRVALGNAASITDMFPTTECIIAHIKGDGPDPVAMAGAGGMDGAT